jgi:cyanide dihydratase
MEYPRFKAAAVQASSVFLDLEGTVAKACSLIREAGAAGAKLIGFPESFVPGYPSWIWKIGPMGGGAELFARLHRNAVEIPSNAVAELSRAARDAKIFVCVSVTERDGGSLYLSQLWFDPEGDLVARHRKLRPTGPERYIWGDGDGSMMPVIKSPIGNLGGLMCWEHMVPLTSAAMSAMNEQVHVASWPTIAYHRGGAFEAIRDFKVRSGLEDPMPDISAPEIMTRHYALATQTFVIMSTSMLNAEGAELMAPYIPAEQFLIGQGASRIIAPDGSVIGKGVANNEEGLVYADIPLEMVTFAKYMCDPGGHYAVPHVLSLNFNRNRAKAMHDPSSEAGIGKLGFEKLQDFAKAE